MSKREELSSSDDRRAALAAAATALRSWVQTQRTGAAPAGPGSAPQDTASPRPSAGGQGGQAATPPPTRGAFRPPATSILSLGGEEASPEAPVDDVAPQRKWIARTVAAYTLLKAWLAPLKGPAMALAPKAFRAGVVALVVGGLAAGLYVGGRWGVRAYGPAVLAAWDTFVAPTGTVVFETEPPGSQVFVDGTVIGTTPIRAELAPGPQVVEFRRGESIRSVEIDVSTDEPTMARLDWTAARTGTLRVESTPTGATVVIGGRERGTTPLTLTDLTVGTHDVLLRSEAGSVTRRVTIRVDEAAELSEALYPGWMHVSAPIEVQISEGNRSLRLDEQNRVLLAPGAHRVQFQNPALGYLEVRQVQVRPGEITQVVISPSPSTLTVSASLPSEVFVDGERAGYTPLTNFPIRLGTRDIVVRASGGDERSFTLTVSATPVVLNVDYAAP